MNYLLALKPYLFMIPIYLVWFIIFMLAIIKFRSNTKVAVITIIAIILFAISAVISLVWNLIQFSMYNNYAMLDTIKLISTIVDIIDVLLTTIGWSFIAGAIFSERNKI